MCSNGCSYLSWGDLNDHFCVNGLSILCLNSRSLISKFPEFLTHISTLKQKFRFIIITEVWLTSSNDLALGIDGYKDVSLHRVGRRGEALKYIMILI